VKAVLDTHAAIYLALGSRALGASAQTLVTGLAPPELVLSDVSFTEIARLLHDGRIKAGGDLLA
jgi:PIN domain nuclease of toxin-antitoxin system